MLHTTLQHKRPPGPRKILITVDAETNARLDAWTASNFIRTKALSVVILIKKQLFPPVNHV